MYTDSFTLTRKLSWKSAEYVNFFTVADDKHYGYNNRTHKMKFYHSYEEMFDDVAQFHRAGFELHEPGSHTHKGGMWEMSGHYTQSRQLAAAGYWPRKWAWGDKFRKEASPWCLPWQKPASKVPKYLGKTKPVY